MKKPILAIVILSLVGLPNIVTAAAIDQQIIDYSQEQSIILPSAYDGRKYCSSVKDQKSEGSCWNYLANALLETSLMKKYGIIEPNFYDFSEKAMDEATSKEYAGTYGFERKSGEAGCFDMALNYWTRSKLNGPISEVTGQIVPYYVKQTAQIEENNSSEYRADYLKQIKEMVYHYGAVTASYYCSTYTEGKQYYNSYPYACQTELAYYFPGNTVANHGSLIVGWNDQYSKENFNQTCRPSQDGAFLVKNSWGTNWGNQGYFWMSYETAVYDVNAIIEVGESDFYDTIYEYDKHGMLGRMTADTKALTNAYMNQYETNEKQESLTAISTYVTSKGNNYRLYVSTDGKVEHLKEVKAKNVGEYKTEVGYPIEHAGYVTFELEKPLTVSGEFLVAIEVKAQEEGVYNIPIEVNNEEYSNNVEVVQKKGYIASDIAGLKANQKYDVAKQDINLCLKAFTKSVSF